MSAPKAPKSGSSHSSQPRQSSRATRSTGNARSVRNPNSTNHNGSQSANNVSRSAVAQQFSSNRALRFQAAMSARFAQRFAAYRHVHHYWGAWTWGLFSLGSYGMAGQVVGVPDGQTIMVNNAAGVPQRVRLFGVVAPTAAQFSVPSQEHLQGYLLGKFVHVAQVGTDANGTVVGKVFHAGAYLNEGRIAKGFGWYNADDGWDPALAQAEERAQETSAGLWGKSDPAGMYLDKDL